MDAAKAFDCVEWSTLFETLKKMWLWKKTLLHGKEHYTTHLKLVF